MHGSLQVITITSHDLLVQHTAANLLFPAESGARHSLIECFAAFNVEADFEAFVLLLYFHRCITSSRGPTAREPS